MPKPRKSKKRSKQSYIVPVTHFCQFQCEVTVEASSIAEAKRLAVQPEADNGGGYDWERWRLTGSRLRKGESIEVEDL